MPRSPISKIKWKTLQVQFLQSKKAITFPSFELKRNDFVLIKGESGAGKSTLLLLLSGIIPKHINARILGSVPAQLKSAAYIFQNPYSQIVTTKVLEELAFTMENARFAKADMMRRIKKFSKMFEITSLLNHSTKNLSGGECQRLVLASGLAAAPKILFLDEPTAFLDYDARIKFYKLLSQLKERYTIFMVDHNYKASYKLHNRIYNLKPIAARNKTLPITFKAAKRTPNASIRIDNLKFGYSANKTLIENFSLHAKNGEIILIRGKNGAGKSTLLYLIAGILKPHAGTIKVEGDLSFVFQNPESHFCYDTIKEELQGSMPCSELDSFGTKELLEQSPFSLSMGEQRRLSLLTTILENRPIILYDEPAFGQDAINLRKIHQTIKELKRLGRLQIIVTHDYFPTNMVDRVYILKEVQDPRFDLSDERAERTQEYVSTRVREKAKMGILKSEGYTVG